MTQSQLPSATAGAGEPDRPWLGYGLLAGGGGITLLMLLWLVVSGAQGGGIVLGLLLVLVLALPLVGTGLFLVSRQKRDALAATTYAGKRRVLEADRLFRRELAAQLRQLAALPAFSGRPVLAMADDLERATYDSPEWFDTVQVTDADTLSLRRYDDLVWDRVRQLRQHASSPVDPTLDESLRQLDDALDQRRAYLVMGRRAPSIAPADLARAVSDTSSQAPGLERLALNDAVSYEGDDFVVQAVESAFAEGQTWKLARLDPSGPGRQTRWLYVSPGALSIAWLSEQAAPPSPGAATVDGPAGTSLPLTRSGTATVDLEAVRGSARGVLVRYWLYAAGSGSGSGLAYVEQWPDGPTHAYVGEELGASDLQLWPGQVTR